MQKPRGCDKMATLLQEILTNNYEFLANNKCTKEISKYPQKKVCPAHLYGHQTCWTDQQSTGHPPRRCKNNSKCRNLFNRRNGRNRKKSFANHLCFDIKEIFIVGHYDCGVALTSSKDILHNMRSRGVSEQQLKTDWKRFSSLAWSLHRPRQKCTYSH